MVEVKILGIFDHIMGYSKSGKSKLVCVIFIISPGLDTIAAVHNLLHRST